MVHSSLMIYTIVPLGNPGKEYELTRHNAARIVLLHKEDELSLVASSEVFVPTTFMNESGKDVKKYLDYHEGRKLILVYDDKDLALGSVRISYDRGDGGHNGVKSIIDSLGTKEFIRVRIGIAPKGEDGKVMPIQGERVQGFVMGKFTEEELMVIASERGKVIQSIKDIVLFGHEKAMERNN